MILRRTFFILLSSVVVVFLLAAGFFLFTSRGAKSLLKHGLKQLLYLDAIKPRHYTGNLLRGVRWEGTVVRSETLFPAGVNVRIGEITFTNMISLNPRVEFRNARIVFPFSRSALLLNGVCSPQQCEMNLKAQGVAVNDIVAFLERQSFSSIDPQVMAVLKARADARIDGRDITIKWDPRTGNITELAAFDLRVYMAGSDPIFWNGEFKNNQVDFTAHTRWISIAPLAAIFGQQKLLAGVSGTLIDVDVRIIGHISALKILGVFTVEKAAREGMTVKNAACAFGARGPILKEPQLTGVVYIQEGEVAGKGIATIRLQPSRIVFKGQPVKESLNLNGESEVNKVKIDISLKGSLDKPELKLTSSPSFPQDKLLVMLAMNREVSFTADESKTEIGITKGVTRKIGTSYAVEESLDSEGNKVSKNKIGGDLKLTDKVSLEAEREMRAGGKEDLSTDGQRIRDKVLLRYRKAF